MKITTKALGNNFGSKAMADKINVAKLTLSLLCVLDIHSVMSVPLSICLVITHWFRGGCVGRYCQQICHKTVSTVIKDTATNSGHQLRKICLMLASHSRQKNNWEAKRLVQNVILKLQKLKATSSAIALSSKNILFAFEEALKKSHMKRLFSFT